MFKETILIQIINKYSKEFLEEGKKYIEKGKNSTKVIRIEINYVTGKARK